MSNLIHNKQCLLISNTVLNGVGFRYELKVSCHVNNKGWPDSITTVAGSSGEATLIQISRRNRAIILRLRYYGNLIKSVVW